MTEHIGSSAGQHALQLLQFLRLQSVKQGRSSYVVAARLIRHTKHHVSRICTTVFRQKIWPATPTVVPYRRLLTQLYMHSNREMGRHQFVLDIDSTVPTSQPCSNAQLHETWSVESMKVSNNQSHRDTKAFDGLQRLTIWNGMHDCRLRNGQTVPRDGPVTSQSVAGSAVLSLRRSGNWPELGAISSPAV